MDGAVAGALAGAAGAALLRLIDWALSRRSTGAADRKTEAEATKTEVDVLRGVMQELRMQAESLTAQLDHAHTNIRRHLAWDEDVAQRLRAAGQTVPPRPPL